MVHLVHQREQPAEFASWETFPGHPIQVVPGQVSDDSAFVLAEGHDERDEAFEVRKFHAGIVHGFRSLQANTAVHICP